MARYTKDGKKQLRRDPASNKFKWFDLDATEQRAAREYLDAHRRPGTPKNLDAASGGPASGDAQQGGTKPGRKFFERKGAPAGGTEKPPINGQPGPEAPGGGQDPASGTASSTASGAASATSSAAGGTGDQKQRRTETPQGGALRLDGQQVKIDPAAFGSQLVGWHEMAALIFKSDVIKITDKEGQQLAKALTRIADQYRLPINPKTLAWFELVGVVGCIYGPRLAMVVMTKSPAKRAGNNANPQGTDVLGAGNGAAGFGVIRH